MHQSGFCNIWIKTWQQLWIIGVNLKIFIFCYCCLLSHKFDVLVKYLRFKLKLVRVFSAPTFSEAGICFVHCLQNEEQRTMNILLIWDDFAWKHYLLVLTVLCSIIVVVTALFCVVSHWHENTQQAENIYF